MKNTILSALFLASSLPAIPVPTAPAPSIPSGQVPARCLPFKQSKQMASLLDCYLNDSTNAAIASKIKWNYGNGDLVWKNWPQTGKTALATAMQNTVTWYETGMQFYPGPLVPDVPPNVYATDVMNGIHSLTILDGPTVVFPLYIGHVALTLAAEIYAWVPYSIHSYESAPQQPALDPLFETGFAYWAYLDVYGVSHTLGLGPTGSVTPTNAITVFKFLKQNNLIGTTRLDTINRVLNWARWNLWHMYGDTGAQNTYEYFHYWGKSPVFTVLKGSVTADPDGLTATKGLPVHWTAACSGTVSFLRWVLRAANIPVVETSAASHRQAYFIGENLYVTHGDDPYNDFAKSNRPPSAFLIDAATYAAWFPQNDPMLADSNVGRGVREDNIKYPSPALFALYQQDWQEGLSHANGRVYRVFAAHYTVQQLEQMGLWTKLDQLLYQQM